MQAIVLSRDFKMLGDNVLNLFFLVSVLEFTGSGVVQDPFSFIIVDEVILHVGVPIFHCKKTCGIVRHRCALFGSLLMAGSRGHVIFTSVQNHVTATPYLIGQRRLHLQWPDCIGGKY